MSNTSKLLSIIAVFTCLALAKPESAQAQTVPFQEYTCEVKDIREYMGGTAFMPGFPSIVVRCRNTMTFNGLTTNAIAMDSRLPQAPRFLSQAQAAMLSGKPFFAHIAPSFPYNSELAGCAAASCRIVTHMFGIWH